MSPFSGLAGIARTNTESSDYPAHSPTLTILATQADIIMGTAAYVNRPFVFSARCNG
jgi:hypothetical protein